MHPILAGLLLLTALLSWLFIRFLSAWATKRGIGARGGGRHLHRGFIPTVGGVGMLLSFYLGWGGYVWGSGLSFLLDPGIYGLLLGILIIHITGMADDIKGISPQLKFFGSLLAALAYVWVNPIFTELSIPYLGSVKLGSAAPLFSIIWIVGLINALNLIDGIDGLAGSVSFIILGGIAYFAYINGNFTTLTISLFFMASISGFLIHNFPPAKVFMGDNGSLLLGFLLGTLPQKVVAFANGYVNLAVLVFLLMLPFSDTAIAYLRRMIQGKSPFRPDKEHLHHRLLLLGLTPKQTLFFFIGFTLFYLLLSIKIYYSPPFKALMLFLPGLFIFGLALKRLGFVEKRRLYLPRWKVKEQDELILPPFFRKKVAHLILILLSDVGAILASFFVFLHLKIQVTTIAAPLPFQLDELFLIMLVGYWILLFYFNNLYQVLWDTSRVERLFHLTRITAFGVFLLAVPALDFSAINLARIVNFIIYWGLLTIFTYLGRFIIISLERKYHILIFADKNAIIIGQNQTAEKIVADSKKRKDVFLNIVGSVSYTKKPGDLGDLRSLPLLINRYRVEEIIITEVENSAEDVYDVVAIAEGMGVNFKLTPEIYRQLFRSQPSLIGYPLIRLNLPQLNRWQKTMKRSLDLLISFAAVSTGALPVLFYSLYALLKDGKVFYPEIVIGKFGKPFILNKFNERAQNRSITDKIFYLFFFHKWTMFAAIFMGQMSLVGPQLHGWREVKGALRRKAAYRRRFLLKPGLTGPAQMAGFYRKEKLPLEEEVENDVYYWHHLSLALDIKILFNSLSLILLRIAGRVIND